MEDKTLTCRDCGQSFTFTVGEQQFYAERGFSNEPGRCPECRSQRRSTPRSDTGFGGARREREMFRAVCSACGRECEVPFQPRNDRPVYCRDCFQQQRR
ncbi:MAG: zinc-ribbon domain containing protein [Bacillota bacterium]|nr:zinc-ribbon domain containing protein [Bacillota bacterium]